MAPKANKKAQAKKKAKTESEIEDDPGFVSEHLIKVHEALKVIREHPVFKDLESAKPLSLAQGGTQAPFDLQAAKRAVGSEAGCYKCGCNFMWQGIVWMATHRVPINAGQIRAIKKELPYNSPPKTFPFTVTVGVEPETLEQRPEGGWARLSPAEPVHALLFAMQEAIEQGCTEPVLKEWRRVCLTTSFSFENVPVGEARFWRAQNLREQAVQHGLVVRMSVRQRIYDVAGFKLAREKQTGHDFGAEKVAQLYTQHLKLAADSEAISKTFVEDACAIHRRLLSLEPCAKILEWADRELLVNNPWKSIYSLKALLDRASTSDNLIWCMEGLMDAWRMKFIDQSAFSVARLKDPRNSSLECMFFILQFPFTFLFATVPFPTSEIRSGPMF